MSYISNKNQRVRHHHLAATQTNMGRRMHAHSKSQQFLTHRNSQHYLDKNQGVQGSEPQKVIGQDFKFNTIITDYNFKDVERRRMIETTNANHNIWQSIRNASQGLGSQSKAECKPKSELKLKFQSQVTPRSQTKMNAQTLAGTSNQGYENPQSRCLESAVQKQQPRYKMHFLYDNQISQSTSDKHLFKHAAGHLPVQAQQSHAIEYNYIETERQPTAHQEVMKVVPRREDTAAQRRLLTERTPLKATEQKPKRGAQYQTHRPPLGMKREAKHMSQCKSQKNFLKQNAQNVISQNLFSINDNLKNRNYGTLGIYSANLQSRSLKQLPTFEKSASQLQAERLKNFKLEYPTVEDQLKYDAIKHRVEEGLELIESSSEEEELTESQLEEKRKKELGLKMDDFQQDRALEYKKVRQTIREHKKSKYDIDHVHLCEDVDKLKDDHVIEILNSSELYNEIEVVSKERRMQYEIKKQAKHITMNLEGRAEAARKQSLDKIKDIKGQENMHMFLGNKKEQIVNKFVGVLKKKVQQKREKLLEKTNEQIVERIMKHRNFMGQVRITDKNRKEIDGQMKLEEREYKNKPDNKAAEQLLDYLKMEDKQFKTRNNQLLDSNSCNSSHSGSSAERALAHQKHHSKSGVRKDSNILNDAVTKYICTTMNQNNNPLPLFNRITQDKSFPLINYQLNEQILKSFIVVLPKTIPMNITKLYFINNSIPEHFLKRIIQSLYNTQDLKTLVIMQNAIGTSVLKALAEGFAGTTAFSKIKKLIIREPLPPKQRPGSISLLAQAISDKAFELRSLKKLTLSKVGLDRTGIAILAEAVSCNFFINHLDISCNLLDAFSLKTFIDALIVHNQLKSLNLSYNIGKYPKNHNAIELTTESFEASLVSLLYLSKTLMHLDLSGMHLSPKQCCHIAQYGMRRSHTLMAVHLSGMNLKGPDINKFREKLNVREKFSRNPTKFEDKGKKYATIKESEINSILGKTMFNATRALHQFVNRNDISQVAKVKEAIKKPLFENEEGDRLVFQRVLGRNEIFGSHRWVEKVEHKCSVCCKDTYVMVIWNKRLSERQIHGYLFVHSDKEPIDFTMPEYHHPLLCTKDKVHKMLPIKEFQERLKRQANTRLRDSNNEFEVNKLQTLQKVVRRDIKKNLKVHPSYWNYLEYIYDRQNNKDQFESLTDIVADIHKMTKGHSHQVFNFEKYTKLIEQAYAKDPELKFRETYMCAFYTHDNMLVDTQNLLGMVVKHPKLPGVDFMANYKVPRLKHISVNKPLEMKQIKKIHIIRHFKKESSMFAKWIEDTPEGLTKAFYSDMALSKLSKFVKDNEDYEKTMDVLLKYFPQIKEQYITKIANLKSFPQIEWLDFSDLCDRWAIIDKNLLRIAIDRIFVAVNFDENDNEDNDENRLCRYEFIEIIARMAQTKFIQNGAEFKYLHQATEKMLKDYIIPNSNVRMPWQQFRNEHLWTLEVDDLIRANAKNLNLTYRKFATTGRVTEKFMNLDDCVKIFIQLNQTYPTFFRHSFQEELRKLVLSYSLSKMTIINEMNDFNKYFQLEMVEFYEFLGRWAYLLFSSHQLSFPQMLEKLLRMIFVVVGCKFKKPEDEDDEEVLSESDYDDDLVEDLVFAIRNKK